MRLPVLALVIASPLVSPLVASVAEARPVTAGVALGLAQSEQQAANGADPNDTLGLFGRLGLTNRVSGQLELSRTEDSEYSDWKVRKVSLLLVVDLRDRGPLVPTIMAGIGLDEAQNSYGETAEASHIEGGFGLEYRAAGGVTIGADVRMGGRSVNQEEQPVIAIYAPNGLTEGEYRSARLTLGVRF